MLLKKQINGPVICTILFLIICVSFLTTRYAAAGKQDETRRSYKFVRYSSPAWLSNDRVVYVKYVDHHKHAYGLLAHISKGTDLVVKKDIQICSNNLDGADEKIIKVISYKTRGDYKWEDKQFEGVTHIGITACPKGNLIAFWTSGFEGVIAFYVMKPDGTGLKRILRLKSLAENIRNIKWSADGEKILYGKHKQYSNPKYRDLKQNAPELKRALHAGELYIHENSLWIMNTDGSNKQLLVDGSSHGVWFPATKRIFYRPAEKDIRSLRVINIDGTGDQTLEEYHASRANLAGKAKILFDDTIFDDNGNLIAEINKISQPYQLSPDATKVIGIDGYYRIPQERKDIIIRYDGVCVVNSDDTNLRLIVGEEKIRK